MRPLLALSCYVLAVFAGGALLAPWLYELCHAVPFLHGLAESPFSKFVNRALLFFALVGLWPLLRSLGVSSLPEAGLAGLRGQRRHLLNGFILGFISLAAAIAIILLCQGRILNTADPALKYVKYFFRAMLSAVVVAMLEEILFRGGIFGALRRAFDWRFALIASSAIYAIVHFFQSSDWVGPITWSSGLEMLPRMAAGFTDPDQLFPGFLNLTIVGGILALAYQRTGNLWFSIGLHGGWVFWLKFYGFLTDMQPGSNIHFWGTVRLIDGWMVSLNLIATLVALHFILKSKPLPSHGRGN